MRFFHYCTFAFFFYTLKDTLPTVAAAARNYHTKPEWLITENKANVNKERKVR